MEAEHLGRGELEHRLDVATTSLLREKHDRERLQKLYDDLLQTRGKKPWHSRINWVNVGSLVTGVVGILANAGLAPVIVTGVIAPIANLILRQQTTQPIVWTDEDVGTKP